MSYSSHFKDGNTSNQKLIGQESSSSIAPRSICGTAIVIRCTTRQSTGPNPWDLACTLPFFSATITTLESYQDPIFFYMILKTFHGLQLNPPMFPVSIKSFSLYNHQSFPEIADVSTLSCAVYGCKIPGPVLIQHWFRISRRRWGYSFIF